MNREIQKFRAWDGFNKKMSFWTMNDLCTWDKKTDKPSALYEWMQYTGLKDKNGKEIYEGDITTHGVVKWFKGLGWDSGGSEHPGFYFENICSPGNLNDDINYTELDYHIGFNNIEVIGNIYENPDLIN